MDMKPNSTTTQSAPKRYGAQCVKSYLLWHANKLSAMNMPSVKKSACSTILESVKDTMTEMEYASMAVKPARNRRFVGYDLRFQKVRPRKTKEPISDTHISHGVFWIKFLYDSDIIERALTAAVARSWTVLRVVSFCGTCPRPALLTRWHTPSG